MAVSERRFEQIIGSIDRRLVYVGLFVITLLPLVFRWALPMYAGDFSKRLQTTIDALPTDKVVMIASNWDAGTQAENRPQLVAVVRHYMRRGIKFAVFSIGSANAPTLANSTIQRAIEAEGMTGKWNYGEHWVILGYRKAEAPWLRTLSTSISTAWPQDWRGTPYSQIPMLKGVERWGPNGQVSMLMDVTGSTTIEAWYQYLSPTQVKIGLGCTAVMAPEQYPFLDSGQLSGLLTGMKGAAEYEQITNTPGTGGAMMAGQSFAHLYIFILIVFGNVAIIMSRLRGGRSR